MLVVFMLLSNEDSDSVLQKLRHISFNGECDLTDVGNINL